MEKWLQIKKSDHLPPSAAMINNNCIKALPPHTCHCQSVGSQKCLLQNETENSGLILADSRNII